MWDKEYHSFHDSPINFSNDKYTKYDIDEAHILARFM